MRKFEIFIYSSKQDVLVRERSRVMYEQGCENVGIANYSIQFTVYVHLHCCLQSHRDVTL
jgi:hypothetical protein